METVTLPKPLLNKLLDQFSAFMEAYEELEDFSLKNNPEIITSLHTARTQHTQNELVDFADLKRKYVRG